MALSDAIETQTNKYGTQTCRVGALLETMSADDRQAFENAKQQIQLQRQQNTIGSNQYAPITSNAVWRALKSEGHNLSRDSVQRHIADTCRCKSV